MPDLPTTSTALPEGRAAGAARRSRFSRRFRMLWAASILVPLLAFGVASWLAWDDVMSETRTRLLRTADILHEHALRALAVQESLLGATQARVAGMDWDSIERSEEVWRFLATLTHGTPSVGLGLVAPDGRMVNFGRAPQFPPPALDVGDRDYVRAIRAGRSGTFIGEVVDTRPSGAVNFSIAIPRLGPDGRPDGGIIVSGLAPRFFTDFYARFVEHPNDAVLLARLDGSLLASQPMLEMRHLPADAPLLREMREAGAEGTADVTAPGSGIRRLVAFRRLADTELAVAYGVAFDGVRRAWYWRLLPIGLVLALAAETLLVLTALTVRAARRETEALELAATEAAAARAAAESRAAAEAQLRRSEQLGALGKISAGVAHDFNNLVNTVGSASRLMQDQAGDPAQVRRLAAMMQEAAERGARITRRMLDFALRAPDEAGSFEVGPALDAICGLLAETLPRDIVLEWATAEGLPPVRGDRAEFETVIVNLVTNARDAISEGGAIYITATTDGAARPHVQISVADTGEGMAGEVLARAGEPFFTTKAAGQGTGLGLAMARRFAEQDSGGLAIESVPGQGTTVTLRLPIARTPLDET